MTTLRLENFAQIQEATVKFGDLTVLVGPQASGKSLLLQWLKVAIDAPEVIGSLREAGHDVGTTQNLIDLIFGEGMSASWHDDDTRVSLDDRAISPRSWPKRSSSKKPSGKVFFIPAHRALLLTEGWPAPFLKLNADTPVVARLFSQNLYQRFSGRKAASLFPVPRILKSEYRNVIDKAVFHGGRVELQKDKLRYRLQLSYPGGVSLPFMTWTAGQREFTPLLLGLYHVLPPRNRKKRADIDWVVVEEPEMGLHPQAITGLMLLILDLLWRGYKVVISTHSPLILDVVWAIKSVGSTDGNWTLLRNAFGVESSGEIRKVIQHAKTCDYRVFFLELNQTNGRSTAREISGLDPMSEDDAEANWGGLTGFSSQFGVAVREAVLEAEARLSKRVDGRN